MCQLLIYRDYAYVCCRRRAKSWKAVTVEESTYITKAPEIPDPVVVSDETFLHSLPATD